MRKIRALSVLFVVVAALLSVGGAEAQLIDESFDTYATGSPPPWFWWDWGASGTRNVDDTVFRGPSGKSVKFERTVFDGNAFAIGQGFLPVMGGEQVELTFFFQATAVAAEMLSAFGRHEPSNQIAWWVTVGGTFPNAVATFSDSQGWTHIMDVAPNGWYGVHVFADLGAHAYDITVWEDANPTNAVTVTNLDFRDGAAAGIIDQIQFGDFNTSLTPHSDVVFVDDVFFIRPNVFRDGFESGNTDTWSSVSP
jgi:hypothetical protein